MTLVWIESDTIQSTLSTWQARNIVRQAQELARRQTYPAAIERLDVALRLNPASVDALRLQARIYSQFDLPYAIPAWRALLHGESVQAEDRHEFIDLAIRLNRPDLAEPEIARLLSSSDLTPRTLSQAVEFHLRQGHHDQAVEFGRQLHQREPDHPDYAAQFVRALASHPSEAVREEAFRHADAVFRSGPEGRRAALAALAASPRPLPPSAVSQLPHLTPPTGAAATEVIRFAELQLRAEPAARSQVLNALIARLHPSSLEHQAALVEWLNRQGEAARVLALHDLREIVTLPPILMAHLEALARTREWAALKQAAASPLPLEPWALHCFRALAADHLRESDLSRENWRRSFDDADPAPERLLALGDLTFALGAHDKAVEAYQHLTRDRLHRIPAYRRLAQVYAHSQDTQRLRAIMREWSAHVPDDPGPDLEFCYLSALTRKDVDVAQARALRLFERLPERPLHRATLALLEWRRDRPQEALRLIERSPDPLKVLDPRTRLAHAAILHSQNTAPATVRQLLEGLETDALLPEEREMWQRVQRTE
ncbi:MAG: hypothetical protein IT580_15295 [Verrucomicrobiales bacterium]|nr:hypothetical protein [Verrucomicrobiales bacterium]